MIPTTQQPRAFREAANLDNHDLSWARDRHGLNSCEKEAIMRDHRMRPAQIETRAQGTHRVLDPLTFAAPWSRLMEIFSRDRHDQPASKFRLERFLNDKDDNGKGDQYEAAASDLMPNRDSDMGGTEGVTLPSRPRKRLAQRFDVETARFRQPNEPLPVDVSSKAPREAEVIPLDETPGLFRYPIPYRL
jgi:hypothetical protein